MAIGDYISLVPRELAANMEFRERQCKRGYESRAQAAALRRMCRQDVFFFINTFCWTANPMWHPNCPDRPFLTWPFQEHAIRRMSSSLSRAGKPLHIGKTDLIFYKARGTGGTWVALLFALWRWLFFRSQSFLLVSRKKELVDKAKDLNALMPKLDFALDRLPHWLRPTLGPNDRADMKLYNPETHSIFNGETTTSDFSRGGRPTAIIPDEFAFFDLGESFKALRAATGASFCCWFISTTNGVGNAFHKIVTDGEMEVVDFKWEDMPPKRLGLYRSVDGQVEILDKGYEYPPDYKFVNDGRLRSLWYDAEERRTKMRSLMAQEHDRDFVGSGDPFWKPEELEALMAKTRPPTSRNFYFSKNGARGELRLWLADRASKSPPLDRCYVVGVDVSAGTGASNSCLSVFDCRLSEKVGELADPKLDPTELAEIANQVGRWFQDWTGTPALVIWEANGQVGNAFGKRMVALEYPNMYYSTGAGTGDEQKKRTPGLWATRERAQSLTRDYGSALTAGRFSEPSEDGIKECRDYRYLPGGRVEHYKAATSEDASGARDNHGDRVRANALALRGATGISEPVPLEPGAGVVVEVPYDCFYNEMQRNRRARRDKRRVEEGWLTG